MPSNFTEDKSHIISFAQKLIFYITFQVIAIYSKWLIKYSYYIFGSEHIFNFLELDT